MKTTVLLLTLLLSATTFAANGKTVSYKSGDETVHGVLFTPKGKGPFPALVVIHEYWGLVPWVKEQAAKLSDRGYVTLAVDLYRGKATDSPEVAHELMRGLPEDRANRDLLAAVQYLKSLKNVDPAKIGSIGWCMGGGYSLDLAIADPTLAADVINYGHLATDSARLQQIHAPILGLFGAQDKGIPPADVHKFEQDLKQMGKKIDVTIYPDAGHAFQNPDNKNGYRPADTADAWNRTVEFLAANLKK
ncbi:MAG TPA: dienelactone hydrolase family protein [Terriglobales bacterium]|nr:dienelactone hydrolase family protein [Terriglobales bacterium]